MRSLKSIVLSAIRFLYSFLDTPYAPIQSKVPIEALSTLCASTLPATRRDRSLCELIEKDGHDWEGVPTTQHFDVTLELCGSASGYQWNSELSLPFRQVYFANGTTWESVILSGMWQSVQKTLDCLMNNSDVTSKIENIDVDIDGPVVEEELMFQWTYSTDIYLSQPENVTSTTEILIKTLSRLSNLQHLGLSIPYENRSQFDDAMQKLDPSNLPIPAKSVSLGPYTQSILRHMPAVKDVSMRDWSFTYRSDAQMPFIVAIAGLPLDHVKIWVDGNFPKNIEAVMNGVPSLKRLTLEGGMRGTIMDYISPLKSYTHLAELNLPDPSYLDPAFDPPECGNAYDNHPELYDIVAAQAKISEQRLLRVVEEHLPFLETVSFEGSRYNLSRANFTDFIRSFLPLL